jgi:hypothetical protein
MSETPNGTEPVDSPREVVTKTNWKHCHPTALSVKHVADCLLDDGFSVLGGGYKISPTHANVMVTASFPIGRLEREGWRVHAHSTDGEEFTIEVFVLGRAAG